MPKRLSAELRRAVEEGFMSEKQAQYVAQHRAPRSKMSKWIGNIVGGLIFTGTALVVVLALIALARWLFGLAFG